MNKVVKIGLYGASAAMIVFLGGCASEKIMVDFVMPAKAIADVSKVNVVSIKVNANVKGNLAGDNARNAGLVKQLLAMRLYKEGYYQVTDDIWASSDSAEELAKLMNAKNPNHGYGETFIAGGQARAKAVVELDLDLELNYKPVKKEIPFTLSTVPYKRNPTKPGQVPTSSPDAKGIVVDNVKQQAVVYKVTAKGQLSARFAGKDGGAAPVAYANSFAITMPEADRYDACCPSQLKALAAAVTPAINGVVADISPYKETRALVAIDGGDKRVVYLLNAKAFEEVVRVVEELAVSGKATFADLENKGIALEAQGRFNEAKFAYEAASKINPESATARAGAKRVAEALAGKKAVKESGAKKNKDSKFSK